MRGEKCSNYLYCEIRRGGKKMGGIRIEMKRVKLWFKLKKVWYSEDKEVIVRAMLEVKKL
jgi:hypothetical protein